MSLYIRDSDVDALAKQVQKVIKAPNKTEAVRIALQHELDRAQKVLPLRDRIKRFQDMGKELGPDDASLDMKKFMDDMWDGI
ncbi:type II toxin-antitoxin system VapB family antitoxin [Phyllobacterium sp. LjRoot231]|uniref:type II toxin-antitoxin system VapB family antitoxin n=1 Tax=Phyllobacterium sp. LjRoot231 TaxID=3342289 RepID=UPI003ECCF219